MEGDHQVWPPRVRGPAPPLDPGPAPPQDALPPSARLYGTPADPGLRRRLLGRRGRGGGTRPGRSGPRGRARQGPWRRWAIVLAAVLAGAGLVAGAATIVLRVAVPPAPTGRLTDGLAGVSATLPHGWRVGVVAPVTGFTSVARDGSGGLVMARPVPGPVENAEEATAAATELYSRLLLKGDRVSVADDRRIPDGHTRALRAEYQDVANRPAFMRVMLITRGERAVLLVGLLQPEEPARRQALDAVMASIR